MCVELGFECIYQYPTAGSAQREISDATSTALRNVEQRQNSRTVSGLPLVSRSTSPVPEDIIASPNNVGVFLLPSEAQFMDLSKLFFSNPGMLFPYIHEETILRSYATAKGSNFSGVSRSWLALINMMFALATYTRMGPNMPTKKNVIESKIYFERAEVLSKDIDLKKATIETVQFLLLMNQYRQGTQHSGEIWNLHGLTVRLAIQLGLHSKSASNGFSPLDKEIRKRTWFACMILDR
ncbi:hypothetical protein DH86_00000408 [Scytalidium sp. 3C]|nr:hypothetical protein DH86_00000408 [Scytalidium sp. 3C]